MQNTTEGAEAEGRTEVQTEKPEMQIPAMVLGLIGPRVPHFENKGTEPSEHKSPFSPKTAASGEQWLVFCI